MSPTIRGADIFPPPHQCRTGRDNGGQTASRSGTRDQTARGDNDEAVLCRLCSAVITWPRQRIERNGRAHHAFFNPTGITFEITCYRDAPGCLIQGKATDAFTWFAGYRWQIALCRTCYTHLGWRFTADGDAFFGLIDNRLVP